MHKDKLRVVVPNMDRVVKKMKDLMCCGNCAYFGTDECSSFEPNRCCLKWIWDKKNIDDRLKK